MFYVARRLLNILTMFLLVFSAIACGIWGFFKVEVLPALMGGTISRIFYCAMGLFGIYGTHLFIEVSKSQLDSLAEKTASNYEVDEERSYEE